MSDIRNQGTARGPAGPAAARPASRNEAGLAERAHRFAQVLAGHAPEPERSRVSPEAEREASQDAGSGAEPNLGEAGCSGGEASLSQTSDDPRADSRAGMGSPMHDDGRVRDETRGDSDGKPGRGDDDPKAEPPPDPGAVQLLAQARPAPTGLPAPASAAPPAAGPAIADRITAIHNLVADAIRSEIRHLAGEGIHLRLDLAGAVDGLAGLTITLKQQAMDVVLQPLGGALAPELALAAQMLADRLQARFGLQRVQILTARPETQRDGRSRHDDETGEDAA